jgi:hypothetical protein
MKRKPRFDPTLPLRNVRHETFARARIVLETPLRAMRLAGYDKPTVGNAARLDRHPNIVARVRHLSACDNDLGMLTLRRNRIRNLLERIALADRTALFEEVNVPDHDKDGKAIVIDGKPLMCTVRKLRPFGDLTEDERLLIEGLEFDGEKYKAKTVERLPAIAALRKLDGLDRPEKVAFTDPDGNPTAPVAPVNIMYGRPTVGSDNADSRK